MFKFLCRLTDKVLEGKDITFEEAYLLLQVTKQRDIIFLISFANSIREEFKGSVIDLCAIMNAKSGKCSEDCAFCSQSTHHQTDIQRYPLANREDIVREAGEALQMGANRFSIVMSGRNINDPEEIESICSAIEDISSNVGIGRCASVGTLTGETARELKNAGLERYHHNLETAESFFPRICTTHSYQDRIATVKTAKEEGLRICCGGILGLGETPAQRLELAFTLKGLDVDSIPLNFLAPVKGTPLESALPVPPMEILKTIAIFRFILPAKDIRICGGRGKNLRNIQPLIYLAGANGVMIGNYLTTPGSDPKEDLQSIEDLLLVYN